MTFENSESDHLRIERDAGEPLTKRGSQPAVTGSSDEPAALDTEQHLHTPEGLMAAAEEYPETVHNAPEIDAERPVYEDQPEELAPPSTDAERQAR